MEEPMGIPGHAGKTSWSRELQEWLRDCGISFEAEGEATRIILGTTMIQVTERGEGFSVVVSITLPTSGHDLARDIDQVVEAMSVTSRIAGSNSIEYEIDSSLPSYPILYMSIPFDDPEEMVKAIMEGVKSKCKG